MLGSLQDADDALQETLLRAWKGADRYEPRARLSGWVHTIATSVCLTAIARSRAQPVDLVEEIDYLQPYPDRSLDDIVERETVELAFIAAIQLLPPKQRGGPDPARRPGLDCKGGSRGAERLRWRGDDPRARAIGDFFASVPRDGRLDEIRLLSSAANRQRALAAYARDDGKYTPYGLMVMSFDRNRIAEDHGTSTVAPPRPEIAPSSAAAASVSGSVAATWIESSPSSSAVASMANEAPSART